jgi:putative ABC transport system permease protein
MILALLRELSWPELRHHPWRHLAALVAIALGVALAYSVHLVNRSALSEFSAAVRAVNGEPDLEIGGPRDGFDEAVYERIALHPAVAVASPVVEADTSALDVNGKRLAVRAVGVDALVVASVAPALRPVPATSDRFATLRTDVVFLNAAARERLGVAVGDTLRLQVPGGATRAFTVAGSVAAGGPPLVVLDIAGAQEAFARRGRVTRVDVRLTAGSDAAETVRALELPVGVRAAPPGAGSERISNVSRAYRVNLTVLALVAMFTGAFLVFSILSLSVAQRTPHLALLGVLGASARQRLGLVLAESAVLGVAGSLVGLVLGAALAGLALRLVGGDLGGGYFPGVSPTLALDATGTAVYGALGVAAALVGGWLPARAAARLEPAVALKGLGTASGGRRSMAIGAAAIAAGVGLALAPPIAGLPLAAYASVALLLIGGIACVPGIVGVGLAIVREPTSALRLLAVERARHERAGATVAVAGVVARWRSRSR